MNGTVALESADFSTRYPVNLEPVLSTESNGISKGYLRSAMGADSFATGPGIGRGGINWQGVLYRVMGTKLISMTQAGVVAIIGDVGDGGPVALDYGFNQLAINSGTSLYYWDGTNLTQVTDPDLGAPIDMLWFAGYYVMTDGTNVYVTDLADPMSINPMKFGAPDDDPGALQGLFKLRGELYVLCANIIALFENVGGSGFPFQEQPTATIPYGCVGPRAKCRLLDTFAFTGAARNEAPGVYLCGSGTATKISTRSIDDELAKVADLSGVTMESRVFRNEQRLYVHLPTKSLVYLPGASSKAQEPVWYTVASGRGMDKPYRLRNAVLAYGKWFVDDAETPQIGVITEEDGAHFGEAVGWQFATSLIYNAARSFIIHTLELVGLPGRGVKVANPVAFLSTTTDGITYSQERANRLGGPGQRRKRIQWSPHRRARNYLGLKFRGDSDSLAGFAALESEIEGLSA